MSKVDEFDAPRISLDQWRSLIAVVEAGGYAQAAEKLHKSQSAVTYAVQKLESNLGIKAFTLEGRKAVLTQAGTMLYRRAKVLLDDALRLEGVAHTVSAGWESEISVAVDALFPTWLLLECIDRFGQDSPHTRIELYETVIGGGSEALSTRGVQLAILPEIPEGYSGVPLFSQLRIIPVAHVDHPLNQLKRELTLNDLRNYRHIVVRDSSSRRNKEVGTVEVAQRWTVSNMATSIGAVCRGFGFAWLPEVKIRDELSQEILIPLKLVEGGERFVQMYLVFADRESAGPGTLRLADIIKNSGDNNRI